MAWWVVLGHIAYVFGDHWGKLSSNGSAVDVFIILSGFVITLLLSQTRESYGPFLTRRWFRLFPVYGAVLAASVLTLSIQQYGLTANPFLTTLESPRQLMRENILLAAQSQPLAHLAAHATLLHGLIPRSLLPYADLTLIGQAWSLSVEWQYYLLAPLVAWLIATRRWFSLTALALVLIGLRFVPGYHGVGAYLPNVVHWFIAGIGSFYLWNTHRLGMLPQTARKALPAALGLAALAGILTKQPALVIWAAMLTHLLNLAPKTTAPLANLLTHPILQRLGATSYPVYVAHMLVLYLAMALLAPLQTMPLLWSAALVLLTCAATHLLATLLHTRIELPGMALGRKFSRPT